MTKKYETPWAPSQYKGMSCACIHPDASECLRLRCFTQYEIRYQGRDVDGECECCCHERDEFEEDEY